MGERVPPKISRSVTVSGERDVSSSPRIARVKKFGGSCHSPRVCSSLPSSADFSASPLPKLKIKNFAFSDLPQIRDLSFQELNHILTKQQRFTTLDLRNAILEQVQYSSDADFEDIIETDS